MTITKEDVRGIWARDTDLDEAVDAHEQKRRNARGLALLSLAFATLGVIYGDIGTSPLYTLGSIFSDGAPENDENIILGTMSTIFWTLTSIVLIKYVIFTLMAGDHGEGGLMALYALICRAIGVRSAAASDATDAGLVRFDGAPSNPSTLGAKVAAAFQRSKFLQGLLLVVVMIGSNMVLSDGVLTPAISVVSAVEGIQYQTGISRGAVVGISVAILVLLFSAQHLGTHKISMVFSPVMLLWFAANASIGLYRIIELGPSVFKALSPHYMYWFWSGRASEAWRQLGSVMLAVTGSEALYADLGHFSLPAIRISFITTVYPALTLTYLGQTACILDDPASASSAYWSFLPKPIYWPMVVLATLAAIIASQALISGAFSIVHQAQALNVFPRLRVRHTSSEVSGQIFMPAINWALLIGCVFVVAIFQTSTRLGAAYGLAVITVMLLDTSLLALLMLTGWCWNVFAVFAFWLVFTFICAAFWSSNLVKVPHGAWFSLALSAVLTVLTYTWYWGQSLKARTMEEQCIRLKDLFEEIPESDVGSGPAPRGGTGPAVVSSIALTRSSPTSSSRSGPSGVTWGAGLVDIARSSTATHVTDKGSVLGSAQAAAPPLQNLRLAGTKQPLSRVPGVGIFFSETLTGCPPVMVRFLSQVPVLHEVIIFLTNRTVPVPNVLPTERLLVRRLRFSGFYHVVARYGYLDVADQGPEFMALVAQEIREYLDPDISGLGDWHAFEQGDVEAALTSGGLTPRPSALPLREGAMRVVSMHLGDLAAEEGGDTVMSRSSGISHRTINWALPPVAESGDGGGPGSVVPGALPGAPLPSPWIQQPSILRRVRAGSSSHPREAPKPVAGAGGAGPTKVVAHASSLSLPLPPRHGRGSLNVALEALQAQQQRRRDGVVGAGESTVHLSLPLPADPTRSAVGGLRSIFDERPPSEPPSLPLPPRLARPPIWHVAPSFQQATIRGPAAASLQRGLRANLEKEAAAAAEERERQQAAELAVHKEAGGRGIALDAETEVPGSADLATLATPAVPITESERERTLLAAALEAGSTYLIGHSRLSPAAGSVPIKAWWLNVAYHTIVRNVHPTWAAYKVPPEAMLELGVTIMVSLN